MSFAPGIINADVDYRFVATRDFGICTYRSIRRLRSTSRRQVSAGTDRFDGQRSKAIAGNSDSRLTTQGKESGARRPVQSRAGRIT